MTAIEHEASCERVDWKRYGMTEISRLQKTGIRFRAESEAGSGFSTSGLVNLLFVRETPAAAAGPLGKSLNVIAIFGAGSAEAANSESGMARAIAA
jgi:hypothetical protein